MSDLDYIFYAYKLHFVNLAVTAVSLGLSLFLTRRVRKLKLEQEKHLEFLLKVKHDIPEMANQIQDLQDQIILPPKNDLH